MNLKPINSSPSKRRRYDDAFRAEALRLANESRSTQARARKTSGSFYSVGRKRCKRKQDGVARQDEDTGSGPSRP